VVEISGDLLVNVMSVIDSIIEVIPIPVFVFTLLAIPIGWHIYVTYIEQKRKVDHKPAYRKD
jgi:hypothetical protein